MYQKIRPRFGKAVLPPRNQGKEKENQPARIYCPRSFKAGSDPYLSSTRHSISAVGAW